MKMKKFKSAIVFALCALLLCTMLCGCGANTSDMAVSEEMAPMEGEYGFYDYGLADTEMSTESAGVTGSDGEFERKIVRNADISLEADDARACYSELVACAAELGGYESSCSINSNESGSSYRYVSINAQIKLPPEQLDTFLAKVGELGTVTHLETSRDEITAEYYDVALRLETAREQLDTYYGLLDTAQNIDEVLSIQTRIDQLVSDIEYYEGMIRYYDSMVDESTVTVYIHQEIDVPVGEDDFEWDSLGAKDVLRLIKNGFLGVLNFLWSALLWLFIIVVSALPLAVIGVPAFFLIRRYRKKHPKKPKPTHVVYYPPAQPAAVPQQQPTDNK